MMTISQFARAAGLKTSTVRFYERQGLLAPEFGANGYRLYGPKHLEAASEIRLGKAAGLSIGEIGRLSRLWMSNETTTEQKVKALRDQQTDCRACRDQLNRSIAYMGELIAWMESGERGPKPEFEPIASTDTME